MQPAHWVAIATLAALPFAAAHAQENSKAPDPTDPGAAVHSVVYESVFNAYQAASETSEPPEKLWRAVNDDMGRLGGHVGHTKALAARESMPAGHSMHQK